MTSTSTLIYGIKNCDTIKKTLKWMDVNHFPYVFHDYRKDGINEDMLRTFVEKLGWESLINKRGTTYRALSDEEKSTLNEDKAIAIMLDKPAIIKRPLLVHNKQYLLGFSDTQFRVLLSS